MRKILVIAALIIGVISCGKEEDSATGNYPEIVGTWRIVDGEVNGQRTSLNPDLTYEDKQAQDCAKRSTLKFLSNGDFRGVHYIPIMEPKKIDGRYYGFSYAKCYKLDFDEGATEGTVKYKIRNRKIIIYGNDNDGESEEFEFFNIESLSGRTLKVSYSGDARSIFEGIKSFAEQHNLKIPEYYNVALNGFIIMEKQ
ncbi:hypothetical protein [Capnocytophaga cynodegmi]|uniref:hypothetical protein n=1 Tax=Capnocytophaga cynodegmi TaxID=28189 RepID=UPI00385A2F6B